MRGSGWRVKFLIGNQKFRPGRQWPAAENASLEAWTDRQTHRQVVLLERLLYL